MKVETRWTRSSRLVRIAPPSPPTAMFLLGKKEKVAMSPNEPTRCPLSEAPCACAESSMTGIPCSLAMSKIAVSIGCPYKCTAMMAFVWGVMAASTAAGSNV